MDDPASARAKLDFLIEEEKQRFKLADDRIKAYDGEATAAITASVALGAASIAGFSEVSLSGFTLAAVVTAGVLLVAAIGAALLSRRSPEPMVRLVQISPEAVRSYEDLRRIEQGKAEAASSLGPEADEVELRQSYREVWRARAERAEFAATEKEKRVRFSLIAVYFAVGVLAIVAGSEFILN